MPYYSVKHTIAVWVKIDFNNTELRQQIETARAKWLAEHKAWERDYDIAKKMKITKRRVKRVAG